MQERQVTIGDTTYPLSDPFLVLATQNPLEQEGTYQLPEAQLDRFMLSIHVDYPTPEDELAIAARPARFRTEDLDLEPVAGGADFAAFIDVVDHAPLSPHVLAYAVALTTATRPKQPGASDYIQRYVAWGVGPRGGQHLVTAAKAAALLDGRPAPEARDVRDMALAVLRHRIICNYNALGEGLDSADIVAHLLDTVQEPSA